MRRTLRFALTVVAAAAIGGSGAGSAHADGDLLSGLLSPVVCGLQNNVNGSNNQVTQGGTCHQSSTPTPPAPSTGIAGYEPILLDRVVLEGGSSAGRGGFCPAGKRVLSGGVRPTTGTGASSAVTVSFSGPRDDGTGWDVAANNAGPDTVSLDFYMICANVSN
ncbi:hypothetical protein EF912_02450 [Streptomyces sp. WAC07061]|uniref:hypothetical protein n=1 Tax=Streptomyces sp. WAC07061 TaxID=2487410 RepID=UPI000F7A4C04|nr:hypothetical protein [Streptomyces sp. WAC07061]RSS64129.1 hypothetical protein EF912_02450 [Streptomyces sp. WAC07061]